jgi:hypothetical protein
MARTVEWAVRLYLFEEDGTTKARAVLDTGTSTVTGHGTARCSPEDLDVPEIGDELAAGRALTGLGRLLMRVADQDLAGLGAAPPGRARPAPDGWADAAL